MSIRCPARAACRGFTLIELIVFIIIVGVGLAGILSVFNITTQHSADPMVRKQMLALAESLMEEVSMMPFTYCDPDDPNAATATSAADCTGGAGGANDESALPLGPEAGEARGSATMPFDNVSDYNGLNLATVTDASGTHSFPGYSARISVANTSAANRLGGISVDADVVLITVTVTHGADSLTLDGYRTRHAPSLLP